MHADTFLRETVAIANRMPKAAIERMARHLADVRDIGCTVYLIGLGGSAANCSHAAADFRRLCGIRAEALTDNMAEFSARVNDDGFANIFTDWLKANHVWKGDALFVLSVGGGTSRVSAPITKAVRYAKSRGVRVLGIVGPKGGETAKLGHCVVKVPANERITPHSEAFQAVVWHLLVSHPLLQKRPTKW